jgi:general secretion pathway protein A
VDFLGHWDLKEKPFENTGDPKFFYFSPNHKEALVRLIYVIKQNKAGALLAGDYGTGKTTIARELLAEIEENDMYSSVYISNPLLSTKELLQEITYQLGGEDKGLTRLKLRRLIEDKLKRTADEGHHTVIVVDEAHLLTRKDLLEELRLLMNMQYKNRYLSTLIMMGQLELKDVIDSMPQFKQRFAIYYVLGHLDAAETAKYIRHRLKIAGIDRDIFDGEVDPLIHGYSSGSPRQINNICDMALLVGYMRGSQIIQPSIIEEVVKDLGGSV